MLLVCFGEGALIPSAVDRVSSVAVVMPLALAMSADPWAAQRSFAIVTPLAAAPESFASVIPPSEAETFGTVSGSAALPSIALAWFSRFAKFDPWTGNRSERSEVFIGDANDPKAGTEVGNAALIVTT